MHSASNLANDFHMDVKVACNDEAIIQKPLPRLLNQLDLVWIGHLQQKNLIENDAKSLSRPLAWLL